MKAIGLLALGILTADMASAAAQTFPSRAVTLVVPYPADESRASPDGYTLVQGNWASNVLGAGRSHQGPGIKAQ